MQSFALKEALGRFKNLERVLDNLHEGIIVHDLNHKIIFFNRAAGELTGYKRENVLGQDCHTVFGNPFCGPFCLFKECRDTGFNDKTTQRIAFTTAGGRMLNLEMNLTLIYDENDKPLSVLAAFKNYTEILKLGAAKPAATSFEGIIGQDPQMAEIFRQVQDIAAYDFPVYIFGETGTGKELIAQAIHNRSKRKNANFVPINCGALPEGLLESELFGHVRGAFSGAVKDKKGRLELAHNGTVFLDEIGEMPLNAQTRLLRFLQEGVLERVGATANVKVNAHVICATNKDLKAEVLKGRFREDLFYRLNVIPLTLPPLRARKSDVLLLVNHFLKHTARHHAAAEIPRIDRQALAALMDYDWPGNVRELQNAIQFAFVKSRGRKIITLNDLPMELQNTSLPPANLAGPLPLARVNNHRLTREAIDQALMRANGNKSKAAQILGVSRATLYRHL